MLGTAIIKGCDLMIDRRTKNAKIFRDTERQYISNSILIQTIQQSP